MHLEPHPSLSVRCAASPGPAIVAGSEAGMAAATEHRVMAASKSSKGPEARSGHSHLTSEEAARRTMALSALHELPELLLHPTCPAPSMAPATCSAAEPSSSGILLMASASALASAPKTSPSGTAPSGLPEAEMPSAG